MSELMPRLYGRCRNALRVLVLRVDYLDREAQLALARQASMIEGCAPKVIAAGR